MNKRPLTTGLWSLCFVSAAIKPPWFSRELACYWPVSCKSSSSISGFGNLCSRCVAFLKACFSTRRAKKVLIFHLYWIHFTHSNDPKENKAKSNTVSFTNHSPKSWLTKQLKKKNTEHWNLSISKRSRIPNHDNQAHLAKSSFTYRIQRIWVFYRLSVIRINEAREKTTTFHGQYPAPLRYALDSFLKRFLTWFKRVWYIPSAAGFFYGSRVITSWISQKNCNIDWYKMVPSSLILTANQQVFQSKPG